MVLTENFKFADRIRARLLPDGEPFNVIVRTVSPTTIELLAADPMPEGEHFALSSPGPTESPMDIRCASTECHQGGCGQSAFVIAARLVPATERKPAEVREVVPGYFNFGLQ